MRGRRRVSPGARRFKRAHAEIAERGRNVWGATAALSSIAETPAALPPRTAGQASSGTRKSSLDRLPMKGGVKFGHFCTGETPVPPNTENQTIPGSPDLDPIGTFAPLVGPRRVVV